LNIVGNALDAVEGRENGAFKVELVFDSETSYVSVSVSDNGPGIAPELMAQIFNIFESTKGARGTGIGLAVSQKIIREHGGDIRVTSQPGEGATFILEWPLIDSVAEPGNSGTATRPDRAIGEST
jgi:two-component system NtrC family sensor kinase